MRAKTCKWRVCKIIIGIGVYAGVGELVRES